MSAPPDPRVTDRSSGPIGPSELPGAAGDAGRGSLIYCGLCGALNPATNHYCAACGTTLVDAFHASEGLRVFERPDSAARLIEIVPSGNELEIVEDPDAPADFVRIRLAHGRLGYIRLQEVESLAAGVAAPGAARGIPDINTNARGCITQSSALGALALLVATSTLGAALLVLTDSPDVGILAGVFCVVAAPLLLLTVGLYIFARGRDERLAEDEDDEEAGSGETARLTGPDAGATGGADATVTSGAPRA
ncbi:MAG: hypothetical protein WKF80_03085 [Thermomicrobiales bacterium]